MTERDIFVAALEIDNPATRHDYVAGACGSDTALRGRVDGLLNALNRAGDFLQTPPAADALLDLSPPESHDAPGSMIGPYKLMEEIGEGGMGVVYVADQNAPVKRRVALKVVKPGMDTRQVLSRFEAERQALALMDHPNIARILDGGTTDRGRPYFVMELVRGLPITDYCDQAHLPTRQRLELFAQVCRAVQHAHTKGIIHRDLKPSNVLVTLYDGRPVPKVIDFGIAKAVGTRLTDHTVYTGLAQMVGTPLYMSPEQAEMSGLDVDTRSDVYSLGVLLYELLTGTTPFDAESLRSAGFDGMRRLIRESEPPRPSQRLSTLAAAARSTVSERRGVDDRQLGRQLRGELDWVVMKCLEKDRDRRYQSAGALAADVERYLSDEPVEARPPSAWYRLRKSARRNKAALATAAVFAAVLVAATAVSTWQAVEARAAQKQAEADRDRAETAEGRAATEAAIARAVSDFLQADLLGQAAGAPQFGLEIGGTPYLTVKEALDRAAARIDQRFQNQPLVEAAIRTTIGAAYDSLHERRLAVPHLERAVELRKAHLGPDHADTLRSMDLLATAYSWIGRHSDAINLRQQTLEIRRARFGPDHPDTLSGVRGLAGAYQFAGQLDSCARLLEQVLEQHLTAHGSTHPNTLQVMQALAWTYALMDRLADSLALHEQVHAAHVVAFGPDHGSTWNVLGFVRVCQWAGKLDQADRLLRDALEQFLKRDDSLASRAQKANTLGWLALNLLLQERYDEAEPLAREAVSTFAKQDPDSARHYYWVSLLGAVLSGQKKYDEAEPLLMQGYQGLQQWKAQHPAVKRQLSQASDWIVRLYEVTGRPEKARAWREKPM